MKFQLVDEILKRQLVSPSQLPESQEQPPSQEPLLPSQEQDTTQPE